jgi:hypothetical protein
MIYIIGPKDKGMYPNIINTTSRATKWSRKLSPFLLGPVTLYDDYEAQNVENGWQYSKLYAEYADGKGEPTADYWKWAEQGWAQSVARRYPMGKGKKPLCSLWKGEKLTYIEARKKIYIPMYAEAVKDTETFKHLKNAYMTLGDITLWDFDGYDFRAMKRNYDDVINDPEKKVGHSFVLAMLLEGEL